MTIISDYIAQQAKYLDPDSATAMSSLPDSAWPTLLAGLAVINPGATLPGIDCAVVVTHETLADFDAARAQHWANRGGRADCTCAGRPAVHYTGHQKRRGQPRSDMLVIDLGDIRAVIC